MQKKMLFFAICVFLFGVSLFAQTTGRLSGRVVDERGNAIAYANVILQGTQIGAATDELGRFMIINITPGTYTVIVSSVGYARYVMENVRISLDETRTLPNISLQRATVDMEELRVVAREELIERGRSGSGSAITADTITDIAVSDIEGLISLTAGVTRAPDGSLNVRGGRSNEVVYTIDGMSISDPVDGGRAMSIDMDAVAEMRVMTGGFTAEFGNAQSGMVNIITRDGTENWEGRLELTTDHLFTDGNNYDEIKFSLGGPIPIYLFDSSLRSKLTFFLNGAASWDDTRYRSYYRSDPNRDLRYLSDEVYEIYDPYSERDSFVGFDFGNRNNNTYNLNLKTTYNMNPMQRFTLALRGDRYYQTPYWHQNRFALQHYREIDTRQSQVMFTYDHVFDSRRTLQVRGSYFHNNISQKPRGISGDEYIRQIPKEILNDPYYPGDPEMGIDFHGWYTIDANRDGIYDGLYPSSGNWVYDIDSLADPRGVRGFLAPGTIWDNYIDDEATQYTLRLDYEYQVSQIVGTKTGFELIQHDIRKNQLLSFLDIYYDRYTNYLADCDTIRSVFNDVTGQRVLIYSWDDYLDAAIASHGFRDGYKANPLQFAYYAQTRMDWEGMIVNAGVRMDLWYLGQSYDILLDDGSYRKRDFTSSERTQLMFSPRLGVSHPISERDVIHFAYNYQNQLPQMRYIFTTRDTLDAKDLPGITVGNPSLEPQVTITYEVGLQHLLSDDYVLGLTAYYKNIYNYVSTRRAQIEGENQIYWYEYFSDDYGSARGLDFTLNRRMYNFISGGVSYSIAWAYGNNSETVVQDFDTSLREFPLDWDIRHQVNLNAIFRVARGEEWMVPFTYWVFPVDDFSISLNYNYSSGRPYTPIALDSETRLETNSKRMPGTSQTDLRLAKNFPTGGNSYIRATFMIENLFKNNNVNYVYGRTGSPYYDGANLTEAMYPDYVFPETQFMHDAWTHDPRNVNNSRNFVFGVSYNF